MRFAKLVPALLALGLAAQARAAGTAIIKVPAGAIYPVTLPGASIPMPLIAPALTPVSGPVSFPTSLPVIKAPSIVPVKFPGVPSPLPVKLPVALVAGRLAAPSIADHFALNWSLLDDKGGTTGHDEDDAAMLVPADGGPKPLPPGGAMNALRDLAKDRESIRVERPALNFDGRKESAREIVLPHGKLQ